MAVEWVERTLKPATAKLGRFVFLTDNLTAQMQDTYKEAVSNTNGVVWYGLPNAANIWQPVDAGYGKVLNMITEQEHHKWLDDEEHADRWHGNEEPYSAKERRTLTTHWAGEAYKKLAIKKYDDLRKKIWIKTGCLITADGSDDEQTAPERLSNYSVPPPHQFLEPATSLPDINNVDSAEPAPPDECA